MEITSQIVADFRAAYPEFPNSTYALDSQVIVALQDADNETGPRWGSYSNPARSIKKRGMFAYAAHTLAMRQMQFQRMSAGVVPTVGGQVNAKSVGDESTEYSVTTPNYEHAVADGDLYLTAYGKDFLRLRSRIIGPVMV